jgi:hypothetical protein
MNILIVYAQDNTEALLSAAYLIHWYQLSFRKEDVSCASLAVTKEMNLDGYVSGANYSRAYILGIHDPVKFIDQQNDRDTPTTIVGTSPYLTAVEASILGDYSNVTYKSTMRGRALPALAMGEIVTHLHPSIYTSSLDLPKNDMVSRTSEAVVRNYRNTLVVESRNARAAKMLVESKHFYTNRDITQAVEFLNDCVAGSILGALDLV